MKTIIRIYNFILIKLTFIIISILNIYYPVMKLVSGKSKKFNIYNITDKEKEDINISINIFADKFNIIDEYKDEFFSIINKLSKYENYYSYINKDQHFCYSNIRYVFNIIELAKDAIKALENVDKDNKSIAYYENSKSSSIDNLINEYTKELNSNNYKKRYLKQSINEIKLKRILTRMKNKNHRLFFNFYLTIFSIYPIKYLKMPKEDQDIFNLIKDFIDFLSLGYATKKQIHKSVAIQIYYLYKNKFNNEKDLFDLIGNLIDLCFQTDKPYKNFNHIDKEPYIKNLVLKFPVFECNSFYTLKQQEKVRKIFMHKTIFALPKFFPHFLKQYFVNKFIQKPIKFYQDNTFITFFGIFP